MVLSATQTRPPLQWPFYACICIPPEKRLQYSDNSHFYFNSDMRNHVFPNYLCYPASATKEGCKLKWLAFFVFVFAAKIKSDRQVCFLTIGFV